MRELALHLLDVMENAVRAQATIIRVSVVLDGANRTLTLRVEDDGPGLPVTVDEALDPFFTTKSGKRTGLGLSLFRLAAEQAGGVFSVGQSELGGVSVEAAFQYDHLDRAPLGDVGETLLSVALSAPHIVLACQIEGPNGAYAPVLQEYLTRDSENLMTGVLAFVEAVRQSLRDAGVGQ